MYEPDPKNASWYNPDDLPVLQTEFYDQRNRQIRGQFKRNLAGKECTLIAPDEAEPYAIYLIGPELGRGGEGAVYLAVEIHSGQQVVAKQIQDNEQPAVFVKPEMRALQKLSRYLGIWPSKGEGTWLFMPLFAGVPLLKLIYATNPAFNKEETAHYEQKHSLTPELILQIAQALLAELHHFHQKGILHRDIGPNNILVEVQPAEDEASSPRCSALHLIDLGNQIDLRAGRHAKGIVGTFGYQDPFVITNPPTAKKRKKQKSTYSEATDLLSVGVVLAELLSIHFYQHYLIGLQKSIAEQERFQRPATLAEIHEGLPDIFVTPSQTDNAKHQGLLDLIQHLVCEPEKRWNTDKAISHVKTVLSSRRLVRRLSQRVLDTVDHLLPTQGSPRGTSPTPTSPRGAPASGGSPMRLRRNSIFSDQGSAIDELPASPRSGRPPTAP